MPAYSPSSSPSPPSSVPSSRSPSFNHGAPSQPVHSSLLAAAAAATTAGTPTSDIPITAPIRPSDSTQTLLDDHDPTDEPTQPLLTRKWLRTKPSSKDESSSSEREIERRFLERVNSFDKRELEREDGEDEGGAPPPSPRLRKRRSWGPPVPLQLETVGMGEGAGSPLSPFLRSRRVVEEPERVAVAVGEGSGKGMKGFWRWLWGWL
ncbi:hypothetical protein BC829DRAFT_467083 [Chytridium lagenaria]|nr:hypothetical protein BC829DRAFT_467083 [Chytridium lagenaria]